MRCTATAKTTGKQCRRGAIHGGTVCKKHGGGAPQVKKAAAQRLRELQHPAISRIKKTIEAEPVIAIDEEGKPVMFNGRPVVIESVTPGVALAAARDVLDRTGLETAKRHINEGDSVDPGRDKLSDADLATLIKLARKQQETVH